MSAPALTVYQSGISHISGDQANTFEQTCNNVADLRSFIGKAGVQVFARGQFVPNDGHGGSFMWNASSTAADDGVNVIVPHGGRGAWNRIATTSGGAVVSSDVSNSTVTPTGASSSMTIAALAALVLASGGLNVTTFGALFAQWIASIPTSSSGVAVGGFYMDHGILSQVQP